MADPKYNEKTKKWEFVFDYYENGKRKQIRRTTFNTKREAKEVMLELMNKAKQGELTSSANTETVSSYVEYWLKNIRYLQCESVTLYNSQLYLKNYVNPRIGGIKLKKLTVEQCQGFVKSLHDEGYARNTIERVTTMIKLALDVAVENKLMGMNPMRKVKLPRKTKKEYTVWNTDQISQFLKFTQNRRYHCVYALALLAGMRQGEILGLRWKDIDFDNKILTVRQTLSHYGTELRSGAKTISGERIISLPDVLIDILKKQRTAYLETKLKLGKEFEDIDIVIFNYRNGKTIFPSNLTKTFKKDIKASGLPDIRFHDMRHSHATMLIQQKTNVKVISERLGHSKVGITLDIYSHVLPSMQSEVADVIDKIMVL